MLHFPPAGRRFGAGRSDSDPRSWVGIGTIDGAFVQHFDTTRPDILGQDLTQFEVGIRPNILGCSPQVGGRARPLFKGSFLTQEALFLKVLQPWNRRCRGLCCMRQTSANPCRHATIMLPQALTSHQQVTHCHGVWVSMGAALTGAISG